MPFGEGVTGLHNPFCASPPAAETGENEKKKKKKCSQDTHKPYRAPSERYAQCCKATEGEVCVYCQEVSWAPCSFSLDNNCFDNTFQQGRHKRKEEGAGKGQRQIQGKWNCSQSFNNDGQWLGATILKKQIKKPSVFCHLDIYSINQSVNQSIKGTEGPYILRINSLCQWATAAFINQSTWQVIHISTPSFMEIMCKSTVKL